MKRNRSSVIIMLALIIALLVAIMAMTVSLKGFNACDTSGFIVASLAALITLLIGWNIYSLIDLKETKRDLNYIINDRVNIAKEGALWEVYRTAFEMLARNPTSSGNHSVEPYIRYGLMYIRSSLILDFNDSIAASLAVFESSFSRVNKFIINEVEKNRIKNCLNEIEELNVIKKREEVKAIVELIKGKL